MHVWSVIMLGMNQLLTVAEALQQIERSATPLAPVSQPLARSLGHVLAADVASDVDSPPHDKAMMDGYAVRSDDKTTEREVIEEVFAGDVPTKQVGQGEATRIMTGAPMPAGADAVVPVEQTELSDNRVRFTGPLPPAGKHVMPRGESLRSGQVVLQRGKSIRSAEVALLAEVGSATVSVIPTPMVAVLPTGAELVSPDQKPSRGRIRNSNGPMLLAAIEEAGCRSMDAGVATDERSALRSAILAMRDADVLLVSGGVSAGDRDLAPGVLAELGVEKVFHKVAVKPGKPLWFGVWPAAEGGAPTYVFGLPGNPVSSFVCFQLFVRPLVAKLAGRGFVALPETTASLAGEISHRGGRETYLPARLEPAEGFAPTSGGSRQVRPVRWRGSADLAGLVAANALIRLPVEPVNWPAGQAVGVLQLAGGEG